MQVERTGVRQLVGCADSVIGINSRNDGGQELSRFERFGGELRGRFHFLLRLIETSASRPIRLRTRRNKRAQPLPQNHVGLHAI